ncbi:hypothetical protein [Vaccinia virus]|nr:hypothetical protein [Vaccinia virus]
MADGGSSQNTNLPEDIKRVDKTIWVSPQKTNIKMAADRGALIEQSQSMNIDLADPSYSELPSMHLDGWSLGLKTGMYYLRTKPASDPIQCTLDKDKIKAPVVCDSEICKSCSV